MAKHQRRIGTARIGGVDYLYPQELPAPFHWAPARHPTKRQRQASSQRNARVIAEICRRDFEAGDRVALMTAIYFCLKAGVVVPPWAAEAFGEGYRAVIDKRIASWDAAFGRPWPKGKHLATARRNDRLRWQVHDAVRWQRPKDENLFAKVGKQFGIKRSKCRDLYYNADRKIRDLKKALDALPD